MIRHSNEYCKYCHKRTEHVKDVDEMLCKRCGKKERRFNPFKMIAGKK